MKSAVQILVSFSLSDYTQAIQASQTVKQERFKPCCPTSYPQLFTQTLLNMLKLLPFFSICVTVAKISHIQTTFFQSTRTLLNAWKGSSPVKMLFIGTANPPSKWHSIWMKGKKKGGKRKEKKREKENLISKLDSPKNAKENGGGHVRQYSKKRHKLQSNKPQILPKFHFLEYMLREQQFCCNPIWFETQLFPLKAHVPGTQENLGTFQLQRLQNGKPNTTVCTSCVQWFLCDTVGQI